MRAHLYDITRDDAFRELGEVDVDPPILTDAADDYQYGGRFPDSTPAAAVASEDLHADLPGHAILPASATAAPAPAK